METIQTPPLTGFGADNNRGDGGADLPVIAESSQPSVANIGINASREDITAPSQQSPLRSIVDGAEAKPAEDRNNESQKPMSRNSTGEARSWSSRRTHPLQSLNRTTSNESNFIPKEPKRNSTMNTDASASFEETAPWDRKAILSLDGGGIRGYSALLIIRALMEAIGDIERNYAEKSQTSAGPAVSSYHPILPTVSRTIDTESTSREPGNDSPITTTSAWLPCHYFDYMAGTSTGGLISIMIGRLRMNIDDCIHDYEKFGAKVFGRSRWFSIRMPPPFFWIRSKYNEKHLEDAVKDVVRQRVPKVADFPGGTNFAFDENSVVIAYQQTDDADCEKPYLFRTYKNLHKSKDVEGKALDRNPDLAHDIPIWQVARATSAAPTYFKAAKIDNLEYLDGGFGSNNPSSEICDEVRTMNNHAKACVGVLLSVGTGKNSKVSRWGKTKKWMPASRYINYLNFAKAWASQSETQHTNMIKEKSNFGFKYYRLNVETGFDGMKLDEWRARGSFRTGLGRCLGKLRVKLHTCASEGRSTDDNPNGRNPEKSSKGKVSMETDSTVSPNASLDLADLPIPRWLQPQNKTLKTITDRTNDYLKQDDVKKWIKECATILVEGRRQRALKDPVRWEKTCFGAWYQCNVHECPRAEKEYESLEGMSRHLRGKHRDHFSSSRGTFDKVAFDKALNDCKILVH
ncbi:MAG: hypothetical protein Q9195_009007 [Heterodermia aff. obscurata]